MKRHNALLSEIITLAGGDLRGKDCVIENLNLCNRPTKYSAILGYVTSPKFFEAILQNNSLVAVVITKVLVDELVTYLAGRKDLSFVLADNPEFLFYDMHYALWKTKQFYDYDDNEPVIGEGCEIHPSAVIENGVKIGNNVEIGPNSVVRRGTVIDDNVYIGCCSVIGSEGFQGIKGYPRMIKHVGGTHLCHDAYVGDNTTVGNALFEGVTEVGPYSKLDNHVHFAHNCKCGENCFITACSLLMGSTTLDNNVWLAPNAVTLNGVHVHDDGFIGAISFANKEVFEGEVVAGIPAKVLRKITK